MFKITPKMYGKRLKNFYRESSRIFNPDFGLLRIDWSSRPPILLTQDQLNQLMNIISGDSDGKDPRKP